VFYHLEGTISDITGSMVVVDCHGIGFAVSCSLNTISQLNLGEKKKLLISEIIREDGFDLYGFAEKSEKTLFDMLISVSGIGPKASIAILSANSPAGLIQAIASGNEKALTVAQGVGKKIAQRVILELKDKIGAGDISPSSAGIPSAVRTPASNTNVSQAISALNVLGYNDSEIMSVLNSTDVSQMTTEQIIKAVLKHMV